MGKIRQLLARFKKEYKRATSDTRMSIIGICVLLVILVGGMVLYNLTQDEPLFGFIGRDIFGEDEFDEPDDDEEGSRSENKDTQNDKEAQKKEENASGNNGNGDVHFKVEESATDNSKENGNGGLTPSEDDKDSGSNEESWSMFF